MNPSDETIQEQLLETLRVLYVEDDAEALQELGHYLRRRVASLSVASDGAQALDLCRAHRYDVILCDLWMPGMDGMTFIRALRQEGNQTPVIITSAASDSETILKAVDLGIMKYCVKPIEADELLAALTRIAGDALTESGELVLPGQRLMPRPQRLEMEKALKSGYAHLLKQLTGKGPRDVFASLGADSAELWATEVLTPMEQSLMQIPGSGSMVAYLRKLIYTGNQARFEALLSDAMSVTVVLDDVAVDLHQNTDRLFFRFR